MSNSQGPQSPNPGDLNLWQKLNQIIGQTADETAKLTKAQKDAQRAARETAREYKSTYTEALRNVDDLADEYAKLNRQMDENSRKIKEKQKLLRDMGEAAKDADNILAKMYQSEISQAELANRKLQDQQKLLENHVRDLGLAEDAVELLANAQLRAAKVAKDHAEAVRFGGDALGSFAKQLGVALGAATTFDAYMSKAFTGFGKIREANRDFLQLQYTLANVSKTDFSKMGNPAQALAGQAKIHTEAAQKMMQQYGMSFREASQAISNTTQGIRPRNEAVAQNWQETTIKAANLATQLKLTFGVSEDLSRSLIKQSVETYNRNWGQTEDTLALTAAAMRQLNMDAQHANATFGSLIQSTAKFNTDQKLLALTLYNVSQQTKLNAEQQQELARTATQGIGSQGVTQQMRTVALLRRTQFGREHLTGRSMMENLGILDELQQRNLPELQAAMAQAIPGMKMGANLGNVNERMAATGRLKFFGGTAYQGYGLEGYAQGVRNTEKGTLGEFIGGLARPVPEEAPKNILQEIASRMKAFTGLGVDQFRASRENMEIEAGKAMEGSIGAVNGILQNTMPQMLGWLQIIGVSVGAMATSGLLSKVGTSLLTKGGLGSSMVGGIRGLGTSIAEGFATGGLKGAFGGFKGHMGDILKGFGGEAAEGGLGSLFKGGLGAAEGGLAKGGLGALFKGGMRGLGGLLSKIHLKGWMGLGLGAAALGAMALGGEADAATGLPGLPQRQKTAGDYGAGLLGMMGVGSKEGGLQGGVNGILGGAISGAIMGGVGGAAAGGVGAIPGALLGAAGGAALGFLGGTIPEETIKELIDGIIGGISNISKSTLAGIYDFFGRFLKIISDGVSGIVDFFASIEKLWMGVRDGVASIADIIPGLSQEQKENFKSAMKGGLDAAYHATPIGMASSGAAALKGGTTNEGFSGLGLINKTTGKEFELQASAAAAFKQANEAFKSQYGRNISLISAHRDEDENKAAGGAKNSRHLVGRSIDIDRAEIKRAMPYLAAAGFKPLGGTYFNPKTGKVQSEDNHFDFIGGSAQPMISSSMKSKGSSNIDELISMYSAKHGVDPDLIRAVVEQESHFNPRAQSGAGAKGLMQLMPGTAKEMGISNPFDPAQNLDGGIKYLKKQLDKYGDPRLALAAYNAGPGNVDKAGRRIPAFGETQNYVAKIMANYEKSKRSNLLAQAPSQSGKGNTVINNYNIKVDGAKDPKAVADEVLAKAERKNKNSWLANQQMNAKNQRRS